MLTDLPGQIMRYSANNPDFPVNARGAETQIVSFCGQVLMGSRFGSTWTVSTGPMPMICTMVSSPLAPSQCTAPAGWNAYEPAFKGTALLMSSSLPTPIHQT